LRRLLPALFAAVLVGGTPHDARLERAVFEVMLRFKPCRGEAAPVGWSVEPILASECAIDAQECRSKPRDRRGKKLWPRWSSFYGSWVQKESVAACEARYLTQARALTKELAGEDRPAVLAGYALGLSINESGFREDVQVGRGRSERIKPTDKQYDDAGGQGRGPSNEACWMQILPSMSKKYGGPEALLGLDEEPLRRCWRAGLDQVVAYRRACASPARRRLPPDPTGKMATASLAQGVASLYATGLSCSMTGREIERRGRTIERAVAMVGYSMRKQP